MFAVLVAAALLGALAVLNLFRYMWNASTHRGPLSLRARFALLRLTADLGVVTLEQAALNATDDVDIKVIDEFRKSSEILNRLPFDDAVNPAGGGATMTYAYTRLVTQGTAQFRAINTEYTPAEVTKQRHQTDLHPLGGSFQIDRVLAKIGPAAANEVVLQMEQKIKAAKALFSDAIVNGDSAIDENSFDGLDKALAGSTTELFPDTVTDWSGIAFGNDTAFAALDTFDAFLALLDGPPTAILANRLAIAKLRGVARRAGVYTRDIIQFADGSSFVERYGNVLLIDPGTKAGSNVDVIPVETRDVDNTIYAIAVTGSPAGGDYSLLVTIDGDAQETAAIAYNADATAVQAALLALSNVPAGGVTVSGTTTKTITFTGPLTDVVATLALEDNGLTGGTSPTVTVTEQAQTANGTNLTDIYAVRFGLDGFHGVSLAGQPLVQTWLPDFKTAGAVKTGEVELGPVAVALKATKAAAVLRNVKVA